ncbi:MAG: hypothetical protein ACYC4Q_10535, partial [Victivallaceae bacterium]
AETAVLSAASEGGKLPAPELNLLTHSLRNMPGNAFGQLWSNETEIVRRSEDQGMITNDTDAFKVATRIIAPNVFDNSSSAIPIQVKSVVIIRPGKISPWWMTGYLLSFSTSPMRESSLGSVIVSVLDGSGKTIGTKVVVLRRSYWVSGLLPTAAMCGGKYSIFRSNPEDMKKEEKSLLNQIMARSVVDILNIKSGKATELSPEWINIRTAIVESIISGDEPSVIALLKNCKAQSIGGKESQDMLDLIN